MKGKIYFLVLVWTAVIIQMFINIRMDKANNLVTAFSVSESIPMESEINVSGFYGDFYLSEKESKKLLTNFAKQLGIRDGYTWKTVKEGSCTYLHLQKKARQAYTDLALVTVPIKGEDGSVESSQYLLATISLYDNLDQTIAFQNKLNNMYESAGITPNTNLYMEGERKGKLSDREKEKMVKELFFKVRAQETAAVRTEELYTVYGYTKEFSQFVWQQNEKVNINIAFSYDDRKDMTYIHYGSPFINKSS